MSCRDGLIAQLQEQIDDLTVYLEEERLNHKETRKLVCIACTTVFACLYYLPIHISVLYLFDCEVSPLSWAVAT